MLRNPRVVDARPTGTSSGGSGPSRRRRKAPDDGQARIVATSQTRAELADARCISCFCHRTPRVGSALARVSSSAPDRADPPCFVSPSTIACGLTGRIRRSFARHPIGAPLEAEFQITLDEVCRTSISPHRRLHPRPGPDCAGNLVGETPYGSRRLARPRSRRTPVRARGAPASLLDASTRHRTHLVTSPIIEARCGDTMRYGPGSLTADSRRRGNAAELRLKRSSR